MTTDNEAEDNDVSDAEEESVQEVHPADGLDDVIMLMQPICTEEGFLNEACISELEAAIRNMPESFERLAHEPEWSIPTWISDSEIIGALAGNAVRAFRGVPPRLADVIGFAHSCLLLGPFNEGIDCGGFRLASLSLCDINRLLWDYLGELEPFNDWNKEEVVGKNWIDLSALLHQVCIQIRDVRRHEHAFNIKHKRDYPQ